MLLSRRKERNIKKLQHYLFVVAKSQQIFLFTEVPGRLWGPPTLQSCRHRASFEGLIRLGSEGAQSTPFGAEVKINYRYSFVLCYNHGVDRNKFKILSASQITRS